MYASICIFNSVNICKANSNTIHILIYDVECIAGSNIYAFYCQAYRILNPKLCRYSYIIKQLMCI